LVTTLHKPRMPKPGPCYIYALVDPRTKLIRYIGKTINGTARTNRHNRLAENTGNTMRKRWLYSLLSKGMRAHVVILEWTTANATSGSKRERWWIAFGKREGWPLTNMTDGGDGTPGFPRGKGVRGA
jgi:hypothetical protein